MCSLELGKSEFMLIAGKPASGKSHFIKYLMMNLHRDYSNDPIKYIVVFTTTKFNRAYSDYIPEQFVHDAYYPEVLESLLKIQSSNGASCRAAVIFDDCLPQKAFTSQLFLNLCTTFRHYRVDVIISTQYIYRVPPVVRECATRVVIFRQTTGRSIQALFESFGSWFNSGKEFANFLLASTGNYKFIYFIANSSSDDRAKVYKIKKCPAKIPEFKYEY